MESRRCTCYVFSFPLLILMIQAEGSLMTWLLKKQAFCCKKGEGSSEVAIFLITPLQSAAKMDSHWNRLFILSESPNDTLIYTWSSHSHSHSYIKQHGILNKSSASAFFPRLFFFSPEWRHRRRHWGKHRIAVESALLPTQIILPSHLWLCFKENLLRTTLSVAASARFSREDSEVNERNQILFCFKEICST